MLRIRLTRVGKKNSPSYRVVIADKRKAVKRKFIEIIGNYNPTLKPKQIVIDKERANFWMGLGAQPSDTVHNLMCDLGILDKKDKIKKVYGKKLSKKAEKEGGDKKEAPKTEETTEEAAPEEAVKEEAPEETTETPVKEVETEETPAKEAKTAPTSEESESRPESVGKEEAK